MGLIFEFEGFYTHQPALLLIGTFGVEIILDSSGKKIVGGDSFQGSPKIDFQKGFFTIPRFKRDGVKEQ